MGRGQTRSFFYAVCRNPSSCRTGDDGFRQKTRLKTRFFLALPILRGRAASLTKRPPTPFEPLTDKGFQATLCESNQERCHAHAARSERSPNRSTGAARRRR